MKQEGMVNEGHKRGNVSDFLEPLLTLRLISSGQHLSLWKSSTTQQSIRTYRHFEIESYTVMCS